MAARTRLLVFTDLDGTLLDHHTYSFDAARPALAALRRKGSPLVLCSSKTRAELERHRAELGNVHPFIVENGAAVFVPRGYFPFDMPEACEAGDYLILELGLRYARLCDVLAGVRADFPGIAGFGDMTAEEVADRTGLSLDEARLALRREYDEPFVVPHEAAAEAVRRAAEAAGMQVTRGGRFHHLTGDNDKGAAVRRLIALYARVHPALRTVGLGDSANDLPLLEAVDVPVLVQKPDGAYDPEIRISGLRRAPGIGPAGWNAAILAILREPDGRGRGRGI